MTLFLYGAIILCCTKKCHFYYLYVVFENYNLHFLAYLPNKEFWRTDFEQNVFIVTRRQKLPTSSGSERRFIQKHKSPIESFGEWISRRNLCSRPEGVVTYVEWERTKIYTEIQKPKKKECGAQVATL